MKIPVKLGGHGAAICEIDAAVDDAIADALRDYTGIPGVAHNLDEIKAVREAKCDSIRRKMGRWIDMEDGRLRIEFDLTTMTARVVPTDNWYSAEFGDGEKKVNKTELAAALAAVTAAWQTMEDARELMYAQEKHMKAVYAALATPGQQYLCGCVEGGHRCRRHHLAIYSIDEARTREDDPRWNGLWLGGKKESGDEDFT